MSQSRVCVRGDDKNLGRKFVVRAGHGDASGRVSLGWELWTRTHVTVLSELRDPRHVDFVLAAGGSVKGMYPAPHIHEHLATANCVHLHAQLEQP